jgi:DNA-binding response OmpR family regulator
MSSEKTILVVDDSHFDRELLVKILTRREGFKTFEASSGVECLDIVESQKIDLILMDIMMPGAFGTQILKAIREKFNPIELPIIMTTAKSDATDIVGALHLGANDYLTKPINFDIAISRVSMHLMLAHFSAEMGKFREMAALHSMVTTYNHEINNPLAIAVTALQSLRQDRNDDVSLEKLEKSIWRVAEIIKKINATTGQTEIEYQLYAGKGKMVKLK